MAAETRKDKRPLIVVLIIVIVVLMAAAAVYYFTRPKEAFDLQDGAPPLGYAEGLTVVDDPNALQNAVDDMYKKAAEGNMALEYQNEAASTDGKTFSCYIANSQANSYDMYIDIYADQALTDEIYLSGLVPPGQAFREIELKKALPAGTHRVYVAFTQVEDDHAAIHGQVMVTMDFTVTK